MLSGDGGDQQALQQQAMAIEVTHFHPAKTGDADWACDACGRNVPARKEAEFVIKVKFTRRTWFVARRFGDYLDLHHELEDQIHSNESDESIHLPDPPPKAARNQKINAAFLQDRLAAIQEYVVKLWALPGLLDFDVFVDFVDEPLDEWAAVMLQSQLRMLRERKKYRELTLPSNSTLLKLKGGGGGGNGSDNDNDEGRGEGGGGGDQGGDWATDDEGEDDGGKRRRVPGRFTLCIKVLFC
jgi:hypothetical protein